MPFSADVYGDADWAFTHPKDIPNVTLEQILFAAQDQVLEELRRSYFNAVEVYRVPLRTDSWIHDSPLQAFAQEAGKIYVALDYFAACLPLPSRMKKLGMERKWFLYRYLCRRSLDSLRANSTTLLRALAISSLVPEEWFPKKELETRIENTIRQIGIYRHVEVDCDLNLPPGGLLWLSDVTRQTVARVQEKLTAGQPWPVRLIRSPGRLGGNRPVIVYASHDQKGGEMRLEIFEPGYPLKEHALQVVTKGKHLKVTEIRGSDRHLPVLGLLYEEYSPVALPPECVPWWLRWMAVRQVWMRLLVWMWKRRLFRFS